MTRSRAVTAGRLLLSGFALALLAMPLACHNEMEFSTADSGQPSCQLLTANLDFGTVTVDGSSVDRTFAFRNVGGGQLIGNVRVDSPALTIVSGGGFYSLGPGQLRRVVVRFTPAAAGDFTGQILIGTPCRSVPYQATAIASVVCQMSRLQIDFGTVTTGGPGVDSTFTITNPGTTPLTGRVSASCDAFAIVSGGGDFSLAAGQSRTVTVRFQPTTAGNQDCLIDTGTRVCGDVRAVGIAVNPALCDVSPPRFDFGTVNVGFSASTDFLITNNGGQLLTGAVGESCPAFTITAGGGAYSLGPGESKTVTVRFDPAAAGPDSCTISLGTGCSGPVFTGRGESLPVCSLAPASLDFGTVPPGGSRDLGFTVRNTGGGALTGNVSENCAGFSLVSGGGAFSLAGGDSLHVTVHFQPAASGPYSCTIATGIESCPAVSASGSAEAGPACAVSPATIAMGTIPVGASADTSFTLTNSGGGTLAGSISETCPDFSIVSGGGAYALTAGQSRPVTIRFQPGASGNRSCVIDFGNGLCAGMTVTGAGEALPQCAVNPTSLAFGGVGVGSSSEKSFVITNSGGGTLAGLVALNCPGYSLVSDGGPFSLGPGRSDTVTVHFEPLTAGTLNCTIDLGTACGTLTATGSGLPSSCVITPVSLGFGSVTIGSTASRTFVIRNNGSTPISGNVSASCDAFSITSGAGAFTLAQLQQRSVTVAFSPTSAGTQTCTILTGTAACSDVNATGTGEPPPACGLAPASIDFGTVVVGNHADSTFTITNTGGGTLTGTVAENCAAFSITAGGGTFSLAGGASKTVAVRFTPAAGGPANCTVSTGTNCPGVALSGTGEPAPVCAVSPTTLSFGTVATGGSLDKTFTITNTGGSTLTGTVSAACGEFTVTSGGGAFSLTNGQSRTVTLTFQPVTGGNKNCTVTLGNLLCSSVAATGTGDPPPVCTVSSTTLSYGNVTINTTATRSFTITNTGGQTLTGTVSASCSEFSITAGSGAYSLTANQSRVVTVAFTPTTAGTNKTCAIQTGGSCATVNASGNGVQAPACQLSTTSLDFGLVTADGNTPADRSFTITNVGGGTLTGNVTLPGGCPNYTIASGNGSFSLGAGQAKTITIRFEPAPGAFGTFNCTVDIGNASCGTVSATGVGAVSFQAHVEPLIAASCAANSNCHAGTNSLPDFRVYATASDPTFVDLGNPPQSLLLLKPSAQVSHGGGLVPGWDVGSSNFNLVLLWIQQGVRP